MHEPSASVLTVDDQLGGRGIVPASAAGDPAGACPEELEAAAAISAAAVQAIPATAAARKVTACSVPYDVVADIYTALFPVEYSCT